MLRHSKLVCLLLSSCFHPVSHFMISMTNRLRNFFVLFMIVRLRELVFESSVNPEWRINSKTKCLIFESLAYSLPLNWSSKKAIRKLQNGLRWLTNKHASLLYVCINYKHKNFIILTSAMINNSVINTVYLSSNKF